MRPACRSRCATATSLTLLAISPQFANAVTLKGHVAAAAALPVHARHAHPRPDPRPRGADHARLLPAQEPARAGDRGRRRPARCATTGQRSATLDARHAEPTTRAPAARRARARRPRQRRPQRHDRNASDATSTTATPTTAAQRSAIADRTHARAQRRPPRTRDRSMRRGRPAAANRAQRTPAALFDELNWDYASIERLNLADLTTQVIPFNLGKAMLQGDEANNIALAARRRRHDLQPEGRARAGRRARRGWSRSRARSMRRAIYQLQPGETLKGLLARAGGFTPQAYVYGLELSREETRVRQRENLASRDRAAAGAVGGAGGARRREPSRRRGRRGDERARSATPRRRRRSRVCRASSRTAASPSS